MAHAEQERGNQPDRGLTPHELGQILRAVAANLERYTAPMPHQENQWVNVHEAARILGVKPTTLYKRPYPFKLKEGRNVKFSLRGIHAYMADQERQALDRYHRA